MKELLDILALEQIDRDLHRGLSPPSDTGRIFGGQVVAQALTAAYRSVEDGRICHSLQSYFIRPGDPERPVLFQVERSRDGGSFTTRRVIATQNGEQIYNMACSFQRSEGGLDHQFEMPDAPAPDSLGDERTSWLAVFPEDSEMIQNLLGKRPIEMRPVPPFGFTPGQPRNFENKIWLRTRADGGDDVALNQTFLAYASDYFLLSASMSQHNIRGSEANMQVASLDHSVWFHRPTNFSRWHLYVIDSPSASNARGFNRGSIYREDGVLVASAVQEGLIRQR